MQLHCCIFGIGLRWYIVDSQQDKSHMIEVYYFCNTLQGKIEHTILCYLERSNQVYIEMLYHKYRLD